MEEEKKSNSKVTFLDLNGIEQGIYFLLVRNSDTILEQHKVVIRY